MNTRIPDLSHMASEEVTSKRVRLNGQQVLFDTKVVLMPTVIEKDDTDE